MGSTYQSIQMGSAGEVIEAREGKHAEERTLTHEQVVEGQAGDAKTRRMALDSDGNIIESAGKRTESVVMYNSPSSVYDNVLRADVQKQYDRLVTESDSLERGDPRLKAIAAEIDKLNVRMDEIALMEEQAVRADAREAGREDGAGQVRLQQEHEDTMEFLAELERKRDLRRRGLL